MSATNLFTKQQKEAVGLLSIGTFLEYFDLMLYVHMADCDYFLDGYLLRYNWQLT